MRLAAVRLLLAAACAVLAACSATPSPSVWPSPSPTGSLPPDARIIGNSGLFLAGQPFAVVVATQPAEWTTLWEALDRDLPLPEIDFSREVVFFFGVSGSSSCPEQFERIVVDEPTGHVYAQWASHPPNVPCTDDLQPQGVLVAVSRGVLPAGQFRVTLREDPICGDCSDHPDQVLVDLST